ncbi:glycoside hydrolase family 3 C-terminal domain-containing protein [Tamlana sp. 2_MG-2023]|uniref:glycoside hydrolase family 3 C-terminal domain-containing protein n=1 Tax=unclassified Tamlana TaxID=2614803 RepID=UPI0026E45677|nr:MULTISPECIES: glycoside hydrolase family 3 C-terminal domain-containing protein [unclassified Tamlana]MDO6761283.1 glycoside hydrolase family 3 C-terminal domain-containing protein [Tamlana sp. 2_MG-2023]MDO6791766.1 glycoside hydrolase family 3 C-terminal domain-containing protein [Tamlana sp. 1_MG-2023]
MKTPLFLVRIFILGCLISVPCFAQDVDFSFKDSNLTLEKRVDILVSQMTVDEMIGQLVNKAQELSRFEIPDYDWWNEALHGVARNGKATIFPQGIAIGATFDPDLAKRVATAISTEARAKYIISQKMGNHSKYAGLTFWTPNVNIFRDPRWGRGQETYGEDPYLMSKIGVAFVQGLQGDDPNYLKTAACAKHFAVHSGPENIRHEFNAVASKQDLAETYFPAFEALVKEAKVEGVMAAYNAVYGVPSAASPFLLQETLREDWKFDGYITSDCGAISGISNKLHYAKSPAEAAAVALLAGTNLNCGQTYKQLKKALEQGLVTEEIIAERTKQLFKTRFRLGIVGGDNNNPYTKIGSEHIHAEAHVKLAREAAQKSIVLLKNKNKVLPLSKDIKVPYLTGPFANSADMLMGSYYGVSSNLVTILEGITDAISLGSSLNYRSGALPFHKNINPKNWAPNVAAESDVTICVVGLTADREGEEVDAIASASVGDKVDLKLPENQINYVKEMIQKKKGPLVLVVASGSPISLEDIAEGCDAIVQIWYPGEQGGNAVADVLFGDISPSGHLPITFPKNVSQLPAYEDYSMQGRTYKYMKKEPMFPFGFGLTYSKTEFKNLSLSTSKLKKNHDLEVSIDVANVGDYDIDEVVQLYVNPVKVSGGIPLKSLKAFKRITLIKGESQTVKFKLTPEEFQVVNVAGEKVWRKGQYQVVVGNASPGNRSVELGAALPQEAVITLK